MITVHAAGSLLMNGRPREEYFGSVEFAVILEISDHQNISPHTNRFIYEIVKDLGWFDMDTTRANLFMNGPICTVVSKRVHNSELWYIHNSRGEIIHSGRAKAASTLKM